MTDAQETKPMFDHDSLYNYILRVLEDEFGDFPNNHNVTDRICDAVSEWVPKHGDYWLTDEGVLYVNKGWEIVCAEAPEITEEENERRFQEALKLVKGITHEKLVDLMGEEWLEEFRRVAQ